MIRHRRMARSDLDAVLRWAEAEGWNPGLDDAEAFFAADPEGFFLAEEDGRPVAAISVVVHSDAYAFLGLYICQPSHRGRGIGHRLWQHAIGHAGARTIGLDGVPEQQANYARTGFVRRGETVRYAGRVTPDRSDAIRPARPDDLPALVALEGRASGWAKPAYLTAWFAGASTRATFVQDGQDGIAGAVTIRACTAGAKVGPLIATNRAAALRLLSHAAAEGGEDVMIDVPHTAAPFGADCAACGLVPVFRTARMYRGPDPIPDAGPHLLFATTSLELG